MVLSSFLHFQKNKYTSVCVFAERDLFFSAPESSSFSVPPLSEKVSAPPPLTQLKKENAEMLPEIKKTLSALKNSVELYTLHIAKRKLVFSAYKENIQEYVKHNFNPQEIQLFNTETESGYTGGKFQNIALKQWTKTLPKEGYEEIIDTAEMVSKNSHLGEGMSSQDKKFSDHNDYKKIVSTVKGRAKKIEKNGEISFEFPNPRNRRNGHQCAGYVNDILGIPGRYGSTPQSKLKNILSGDEGKHPKAGRTFVMDGKPYGHVGIINSVKYTSEGQIKGIYITDANSDGHELIRKNYFIDSSDGFYKKIEGFGKGVS